jgi:hypothetical protein
MKLEDPIDEMEDFLSGIEAVVISAISDKDARYRWIHTWWAKFHYIGQSRHGKRVVIRCPMKIGGYSRQQ